MRPVYANKGDKMLKKFQAKNAIILNFKNEKQKKWLVKMKGLKINKEKNRSNELILPISFIRTETATL